MTSPMLISGPNPEYTARALDAQVQGTMLVDCVVTVEGSIRNCRVIRSLPHMDAPVIRALEARRYRPAMEDGRPVAVQYVFKVRLQLPE